MADITFRAGPGRPCPVCGAESKGCSATADGLHFCRGDARPGWRHLPDRSDTGFACYRRAGERPATRPTPARSRADAPPNWSEVAARLARQLTATRRSELAGRLALPVAGLDALPLIGLDGATTAGGTFTFPEVNAAGAVVGIIRRLPDGSKKAMPGSKRGLTVPAGWRDRPGPVLLVEGPSDVLALTAAGLAAVGRPSNTGGVTELAALLRDLPADRRPVVVGENDQKADGQWPGRDGARQTARKLAAALGRPVAWAMTPAPAKDVRAWLTDPARDSIPWPDRGAELAELLTATATAIDPPGRAAPTDGAANDPPCIVVGVDEHRVNAEAAAALAAELDIYQRGGSLVHVIEHVPDAEDADEVIRRPPGAPVVRALPRSLLRERLTRVAFWQQWRGAGEDAALVPVHPPDWCVGAVHDRGDWIGVRRLDSLTTHPVLLPDGRILTTSGYHPKYRLLACLPPGLAVDVPDAPTPADVAAAVDVLLDAVCDFPFQTPAHRAAWVAGLLTPLARFAFAGPAPLFLIDGNVRGVGKGLLADVAALVLTGRRFAVMNYTNDREELQKRITALVMEGEELVLLDNLAGAVGNDVLDMALTGDRWKGRVLGASRTYDGPLGITWFGTGNNVQLHADTSRRTCHARMESADERPETKADFKHPDLREHALRNRGALLSAALTILRGWVAAGKPTHGLKPSGSFEGWSAVVREAVVFAGLPDPGETREALQSTADRDACAMADVLAGLERLDTTGRGLTTAEVIDHIKAADHPGEWLSNLRAAVEELCGKLCGRSLGYRFRHFARRNFGGKCLDAAGDGKHANRWRVRALSVASAVFGSKHPPHPTDPPPPANAKGDAGDSWDVPAGTGDESPGPVSHWSGGPDGQRLFRDRPGLPD